MPIPHVDDLVCLTQDIPELSLHKGESGIVRTIWSFPHLAYEVEFNPPGQDFQTRCLLVGPQVEMYSSADSMQG